MTPRTPSNSQAPGQVFASNREEMEAVWRQRAARLSRRSSAGSTSGDALQVMVLRIGDERYGVELADIAEVLAVRCTPVPGALPAIAGVIDVHGEIRPVIDLHRLLGIEHSAESSASALVVLLRKQGRLVGLQADGVDHIRSVSPVEMRSSEDGLTGLPTRYLKALTHDTLMLLNTGALLDELFTEKGSAS